MEKIGIDARMMSSSFGIGRYIQQLVQQLEHIAPKDVEFFLFMKEDNWGEFETERSNFSKIKADIHWYSLSEQTRFLSILNSHDLDLVHFPHWNIPIFYQGDFVVTIHDLIMFHFPRPEATTHGKTKYWLKDRAHRYVIKKSAKKSKHILTTSEFTKQDIIATLGIDKEKISKTYQAPFNKDKKDLSTKNVQDKFNINDPFVLYVGSAYPHKNLKNLLSAWQEFNKKCSRRYQLVLAGKENYFYRQLKESDLYRSTKNIKHLGFVEDSDLNALYSQSELFVFPSLYEGFGLPPLEALSSNTPVVAADSSCLPEVLQGSAIFADAKDPDQLAESINEALTDDKLRQKNLKNAQELLLNYSWKRLAEKTLDIYRKNL